MNPLAHVRLSASLPIVAGVFLSFLILFLLPDVAQAGISQYFAGLGRRDRVIQVCVIVMCLALAILMKKFGPSNR
jgi:hypothetical protein